jgi:hypothetical protein
MIEAIILYHGQFRRSKGRADRPDRFGMETTASTGGETFLADFEKRKPPAGAN